MSCELTPLNEPPKCGGNYASVKSIYIKSGTNEAYQFYDEKTGTLHGFLGYAKLDNYGQYQIQGQP